MTNPLTYFKRVWSDKKKRPWILGGAGAAGAGAFLAFRSPVGADAATEDAVAEAAAPEPNAIQNGTYGAETAGGGMYGTYVSSPPIDYEPSVEEMDYTPLFDAMTAQGEAFTAELESAVGAESEERARVTQGLARDVTKTARTGKKTAKVAKAGQRQNVRQKKRLDRQAKSLRTQRKALARVKHRVAGKPKKKAKK